jgi:hypothetical protein
LTGISLVFLILVGFLGVFYEIKSGGGDTENTIFDGNRGFYLTHFSISFLIFPGWLGGLIFCLFWFLKVVGITE